jgi:hypothetical protein
MDNMGGMALNLDVTFLETMPSGECCRKSKRNLLNNAAIYKVAGPAPFHIVEACCVSEPPSYMAPANYVAVNRFPLTTSGKLDCSPWVKNLVLFPNSAGPQS